MVNEENKATSKKGGGEEEIKKLSEGHYFKKSLNPDPDYDPPTNDKPTNYVKPPTDKKDSK
jgi:hypothetical protein